MAYTKTRMDQKVENMGRVMVWEPKTRVVLADDHEAVRNGIRNLLRKASDIVVIGEARNGIEAIDLVSQLRPDVLLLDIEMPGMTGIDVVKRLDEAGLSVNILVLSAYDDQEYILELLGSGASGYLLKEETPDYILDAVRGVANGQRGWVSSQVAKKLEKLQSSRRLENTLTFQDMDILKMLSENRSDSEISQELNVDEKTLVRMIHLLMRKLGANSREDAVQFARQNNWL